MNQKSTVCVSGHSLSYVFVNERFNNPGKPWLIFLHEGLGCIGKWKDFPEKLSEEVHLPALVYDRYGYGESDPLKEARKPDFLHTEALVVLPEILEKLSIKKPVILIGHSDGGSIALIFAARFPQRVKALIVEAPHVLVEEVSAKGLQAAILAYQYGDLKERLYKYHGDQTDSMFWGWANIWTHPDNRNWNIEDYLPGTTSPLLFIQGADDEYGSVAQLHAIQKAVKGRLESEIIPGCSHVPHQQAEEFVMERMTDFINNIT
ncbi:MAG: alpha/beta hydrolase [Bacteroidetes bacterium]|nr:alpha/beta hydrolase [Bacteroidota bacterium]